MTTTGWLQGQMQKSLAAGQETMMLSEGAAVER